MDYIPGVVISPAIPPKQGAGPGRARVLPATLGGGGVLFQGTLSDVWLLGCWV